MSETNLNAANQVLGLVGSTTPNCLPASSILITLDGSPSEAVLGAPEDVEEAVEVVEAPEDEAEDDVSEELFEHVLLASSESCFGSWALSSACVFVSSVGFVFFSLSLSLFVTGLSSKDFSVALGDSSFKSHILVLFI